MGAARVTSVVVVVVIAACFVSGAACLHIEQLRVPDAVRNGSEDRLVLDCDFALDADDQLSGLVVKWYFNLAESPSPVYQWIPDKKPQVFGVLKGRLDLDYRASDDRYTMHRALLITNPSPDLTGDYTCTVSTFFNETSRTKRLVVYVPERSLEVTQTKSESAGAVNVTCSAEGVYPQPSIAIQRHESEGGGGDGGAGAEEATQVQRSRTDEGLYDVWAWVVLPDAALASPTTFLCQLSIPEANYSATASSVYTPGPPTTTTEDPPTTSTELVPGSSLPVGTNSASRSTVAWFLSLLLLASLRL